MTMTADGLMTLGGQMLPFSRDLREALAIYARRTWPVNTSGHAAKAWGLPKSTAANLLKGHASDATVTRIIRAGGWELALPVIGAVIGEPVHAFFREQTIKAAKAAQHAEHHERLAQAAWTRLESGTDSARLDRPAASSTRETGARAGEVRANAARGLVR